MINEHDLDAFRLFHETEKTPVEPAIPLRHTHCPRCGEMTETQTHANAQCWNCGAYKNYLAGECYD